MAEKTPQGDLDRKSSYIQARVEKSKRRNGGALSKLAALKRSITEEKVLFEEVQNSLDIEGDILTHHSSDLAKLKMEVIEAQAKQQAKEKEIDVLKKRVNWKREQFKVVAEALERHMAELRQQEEALADKDKLTEAIATRQADIFDLNPSEMKTLATFASGNSEFGSKIQKAATGEATPTMMRDIKSKLFEKLTACSTAEIQDLMKRIWDTMKQDESAGVKPSVERKECQSKVEPEVPHSMPEEPHDIAAPLSDSSSSEPPTEPSTEQVDLSKSVNPEPKDSAGKRPAEQLDPADRDDSKPKIKRRRFKGSLTVRKIVPPVPLPNKSASLDSVHKSENDSDLSPSAAKKEEKRAATKSDDNSVTLLDSQGHPITLFKRPMAVTTP